MNAFDVFELPISIDLDLVQLRKVYIQKQQNSHPDKGGDVVDSEVINKSYTILKDRNSRVKLILELNDIDTNDSTTLPSGFLFEMMEISEMMESLDKESAKTKIEELLNQSDNEFLVLASTFNNSQDSIRQLAVWYQKNKYYTRLDKNSKGIQDI